MLGESPLTLPGSPSPLQDERFLSALSDKSRVWKRYMANVRFVYEKPIRNEGLGVHFGSPKSNGWSESFELFALWATLGAQRRPKATKVDQRASKRRPKSAQRAPKATKVEQKDVQRRPKCDQSRPKYVQQTTKVGPKGAKGD